MSMAASTSEGCEPRSGPFPSRRAQHLREPDRPRLVCRIHAVAVWVTYGLLCGLYQVCGLFRSIRMTLCRRCDHGATHAFTLIHHQRRGARPCVLRRSGRGKSGGVLRRNPAFGPYFSVSPTHSGSHSRRRGTGREFRVSGSGREFRVSGSVSGSARRLLRRGCLSSADCLARVAVCCTGSDRCSIAETRASSN